MLQLQYLCVNIIRGIFYNEYKLNSGGIFMKRKYEKPMAFEEVFAAENYCTTACYKIACIIHSNPELKYGYMWENHSYSTKPDDHRGNNGSGCLNPNLNRILVNGKKVSVEEFSEHGGGANGGNDCMAGGVDWTENETPKPGTIVYWHTSRNNGTKGWNHYGVVEATDSSHPNHS